MAKKTDASTDKNKKSPKDSKDAKSASSKSPSIVTTPLPPRPPVPPIPVATLTGELAAMRGLLTAGEDGHYQLGVHYNRIVDGNLAAQGGYKSAHDMVNTEFKDSVSQASLTVYGMVAKTFSEDIAKEYGCTKLNELVVYLHTVNLPMPSGDPGSTSISVPQSDGTTVSKAFSDCSTQEIRSAKAPSPGATVPQAAQDRQAAFATAMATLLGKTGHVKVTPKMKAGEVVWGIQEVPDGLFVAVMDALKQH